MKREIKIFYSVAVITLVGISITNSYLAPIAIERGIDKSIVGILISMQSFMIMLTTPFYPFIMSKFNRKKIFIGSLVAHVHN